MKNKFIQIIILSIVLSSMFGCLKEEIDFPVVNIEPNTTTVKVGDTVKFSFSGSNIDNVVFYSGEFGNRYNKRNEHLVEAGLQLSFGSLGTFWLTPSEVMSLWYSTDFVDFSEFDLGNKTPEEHWNDATWIQITDAEFNTTNPTGNNADLNSDGKFLFDTIPLDFVKDKKVNFAFRLYSSPETRGQAGIRKYEVSAVSDDLASPIPISTKLNGWRNVTLQSPPGRDAFWRERNDVTWQIKNGGPSQNLTPPQAMEMWLILSPINTDKTVFNVPSDKGVAIKNKIGELIEEYEFTYSKPGTYMATFVLTQGTDTAKGFESQVIEFQIIVTE